MVFLYIGDTFLLTSNLSMSSRLHYEIEITVRRVAEDGQVVNETNTVFEEADSYRAGEHARRSTEGLCENLSR